MTALVTVLAAAATAVIAAVAAWFAIREYRRNGRWKAAELAAAHLQKLTSDDTLRFACQALDWGIGPIVVPTEFRAMVGKDRIEHDVGVLDSALEPQLNEKTLGNEQGLLYRHCLDRLFGFFDGAQELLDLELVEPEHFSGLRYWLDLVAHWRYAKRPEKEKNEVFLPFLVKCDYGRALRLFDSLNVDVEIPDKYRKDAKASKDKAMPPQTKSPLAKWLAKRHRARRDTPPPPSMSPRGHP